MWPWSGSRIDDNVTSMAIDAFAFVDHTYVCQSAKSACAERIRWQVCLSSIAMAQVSMTITMAGAMRYMRAIKACRDTMLMSTQRKQKEREVY